MTEYRFSGAEDRAYWDAKYADELECDIHGEMYWDREEAEYVCLECELNEESYLYG